MNINSSPDVQTSGASKDVAVSPVEKIRNAQPAEQQAKQPTEAELKQMVEKANESLKINNSDLQFEMDKESSEMIVKVIDRETKEVIRQFPSVEMIEMSKAIEKMQGVLVSRTA